ncbi:thioredoxin domain-containing protein [Naumannella huperziae]
MANRLADSLSPYLRQHADNPVDWREWSDEAFAQARERDVPVFLSVGYAACHWCHVMAHESFEDPEIAELINANFVPIKVDREERPDVDAIFMAATQALTGQGGWPMSVWLTPEGRPFYAGTYFPPRQRGGMPGFGQVLTALADAWRDRREEVISSATAIVDHVAATQRALPGEADPAGALARLREDFDPLHGGFGGAPKFPPTMVLDALLADGTPESLEQVAATLDAMIAGGVHDHLGGGFARYSVDAGWVVPHFEKMLYDNALLLGTLARASTRVDPERAAAYRATAERLVGWLDRELLVDGGGYAASLDADSADASGRLVEGAFYVWTPAQLRAVLGADAARAAAAFGVTDRGTFEHGASTLRALAPIEDDWRERLLAARDRRPRPARDDKIVAAWNGWLITALVTAAMIFDRPDWLDRARGAAAYLWDTHWRESDRTLLRVSRDRQPGTAPGIAEDHGALAQAYAALAGATGDATWLDRARTLLDRADELFAAGDGGWYDADAATDLYARPRDLSDNATPSGGSALIAAHRAVAGLTGEGLDRLPAATATGAALATAAPRFAGWWLRELIIADRVAAREIVIFGDDGQLVTTAWREAPEGSVILALPGPSAEFPLARGRGAELPAAYVCTNQACGLPVHDPEGLRAQLA